MGHVDTQCNALVVHAMRMDVLEETSRLAIYVEISLLITQRVIGEAVIL